MTFRRQIIWMTVVLGTSALIYACGTEITFRAYLSKSLWRPTVRPVTDMANGLPPEKTTYVPYAGMPSTGGDTAINAVRQAYDALFLTNDREAKLEWSQETILNLQNLLRLVVPANNAGQNEVDLLRCKIQLRAARAGDDPAFAATESCLDLYLKQPRPPALASEARGWLARTYYLQHKRAAAAKIYLDELANPSSNIRRQRLLASLEMLYPDEDEHRLENLRSDLDDYFDTPAHALFMADRITNSGFLQRRQPVTDVYLDLLKHLDAHKDLFRQGAESDALALELMRGTIRAGAPTKTLEYAAVVAPGAATRANPEYIWLSGAANFQLGNYPAAESSLTRVLDSPSADIRQKRFAENGLVGVYDRTHQPVKELHIAFQAASPRVLYGALPQALEDDLNGSHLNGWNFDIAYLLDLQLTDRELETYLTQYPDPHFAILDTDSSSPRPAVDFVRYALAVRHARREEFAEAARIYRALNVLNRAERMDEAATLFAVTKDPGPTVEQRLQASYDYAEFLSNNEERVFFNDWVWHRFQTSAFVQVPDSQTGFFGGFNYRALGAAEAERYRKQERQLRDEQEEYWRAYQIFNGIVEQAGHTELGHKAAARALFCLRRISPQRFDRRNEIRAADIRLSNWLNDR